MNGKSTPGPWTIQDGQEIMTGSICSGNRRFIAQCHAGHREERNANARLISAAPELLEALRPLAAWAENERRRHNASDEENEAAYMGELADKARAAIKKATGE